MYNTLGANLVLAMWHGLYPMYYAFFLSGAIVTEVGKDVFNSRILFRSVPGPIKNVLGGIIVMFLLNHLGMSFVLLTYEKVSNFLVGICFVPQIILWIAFFFFRFSGVVAFAKKKEKREQERVTSGKKDN